MGHQLLGANEYLQSENDILIFKTEVLGHHAKHEHEFIEIAYIVSGRGVHIANDVKDSVMKGDLVLLNAHVTHEYFAEEDSPLVICNCVFQPLSIDNSFKECVNFLDVAYHYLFRPFYTEDDPKKYIKLSVIKTNEIEVILNNMLKEYGNKENGYMQVIKSELMKLLILIFRLYRKSETQVQDIPFYKKLVVQNAYQYLKQHYYENIKCEKLAERSYLSLSYFNKIFKEMTGKTVIEELQAIRIDSACEILKNTRMPVSDIARSVGYLDLKYFYKLFQQLKSITPGEYRKEKLNSL